MDKGALDTFSTKGSRLTYIDIAKAIGLCLVILSHSVCPRLMFLALGCFVPVFFVASGYTTKTIELKKKAKRLLLPYALFNIGLIVLFIIKQIYISSTQEGIVNNIGGILYSRYAVYPLSSENNIFLMQAGNAPMWFLTSMFMAYVALKPLLAWPKVRGGVICLYLITTWLLSKLPVLLPWSLDTAFFMALFIYVGIVCRNIAILDSKKWWLWIALVIGYGITAYLNGYENLSVRDFGNSILLSLIAGISGSILILKGSMWLSKYKIGNLLASVGKYSLTIFCVQMPLLVCVNYLCGGIIPNVIVAVIQVLATIALGYVIAVFAHRVMPKVL